MVYPAPRCPQHDRSSTVSTVDILPEDERLVVATVREFVDEKVKPVVRELEHANAYPEELINMMKEMGIFGLAVPEATAATSVHRATCWSPKNWRDWIWPGPWSRWCKLLRWHRGTAEAPAEDGHRGNPGHDGADRPGELDRRR